MIARHSPRVSASASSIAARLLTGAAASAVVGLVGVGSAVVGSVLLAPTFAFAAPAAAPVVSADKPFVGVLNDDNVYVRSGPSDVYYATTKLAKGTKVTVVATRNDWLKILPPQGSYSYVAKAYIEKSGDGTVGHVTKADLNVRAGSLLNGLKTTVQTSLEQGEAVKIVGEQEDYFKIVPPAGAYLYVKTSFVDPAPQEVAVIPPVSPDRVHDPIPSDPVPPGGVVVPEQAPTTQSAVTTATPVAPVNTVAVAPSTQPAVAAAPATQPAEPTAEAKFDTAESAFLDASSLPLDQQPVAVLLKQYTALSTDPALPISMRKITDMRIATLKLRADARTQYVAALKLATEAKAKQQSLKAEQDELAQRIKDQQVTIYTALGTLRTSSLQQSGTTMYRLTDPNTGRTLVYIRSNDPKYAGLLNEFIGVKGDITEDANVSLKLISPTDVQAVDQAKVNTSVTATLIPPSMLPKATTASISGN